MSLKLSICIHFEKPKPRLLEPTNVQFQILGKLDMFYLATFWIWQDTWNQTFLFHQRGVRFHPRGWKNQTRSRLWLHGHGKLLWHNVAANQCTTKYCKIQLSLQLDLKVDPKSKSLHSYDFWTLFPPLNNLCTFNKLIIRIIPNLKYTS